MWSEWATRGERERETDRKHKGQNKSNNVVYKIKMMHGINNLSKIWEVSECENLVKHLQLLNFTTNQQTSANYDFEGIKSHSGSWSQMYLLLFLFSRWTAKIFCSDLLICKRRAMKNALTLCHCAAVLLLVSTEPRCGLLCILTARRLFS